MGAADMMLFALLALADACLLVQLNRRRQRRNRMSRMTRSLRVALQRENGAPVVIVREPRGFVWQQAS